MSKINVCSGIQPSEMVEKAVKLQGSPGAPVTVLSGETINTNGCLFTIDPHHTNLELTSILDISIGSVHMVLH